MLCLLLLATKTHTSPPDFVLDVNPTLSLFSCKQIGMGEREFKSLFKQTETFNSALENRSQKWYPAFYPFPTKT